MGIVAGLAVPLRVAGEVIGVLSVGSPSPRVFAAREVALLQTFADQAAIALSHAQTQEAMTKQAERLRLLHEIDRAIITETAPVAIAEAALWRLRDLLGVPRAIVNLFDWEAGEVEWLAAVGRHRMRVGPGVRYPLRFAGDLDALRRGESQVIDVNTLPPGPETDALLASGVLVYMVVPMIIGDQLIGSVSFGGEQGQFPDEQVGIAREVATQLAIAIVQARLLEQVKRHTVELEARVEERTRELESANRELEAFTHTVSHDLKAPLRGMAGFAQALEEDYADRLDDSGRQFLTRIRAASERMADLIDDLLQYSRIQQRPIERRPVALKPLLDPMLEDLASEIAARGLTVTLDLAEAEIMSERQGLQEALANLLSNAVKFSPPQGGTIAVRSYRDGDQAVVASRRPRCRLRHAVPRPHLRHLRAPAPPGGLPGHRRRPGHRAQGRGAPRRAGLGRVRARAGEHVLPGAPRPALEAPARGVRLSRQRAACYHAAVPSKPPAQGPRRLAWPRTRPFQGRDRGFESRRGHQHTLRAA